MADPVDYIRALSSRLRHAELAVQNGMVTRNGNVITFAGATGNVRHINIIRGEHGLRVGPCDPPCEDSQIRADLNRGWCKHRLAALLVLKGELPEEVKASTQQIPSSL